MSLVFFFFVLMKVIRDRFQSASPQQQGGRGWWREGQKWGGRAKMRAKGRPKVTH